MGVRLRARARSNQGGAPASETPDTGSVTGDAIDMAALRDLMDRARALGMEVLPAGAMAAMAARAEKAEMVLQAEAERQRNMPDFTPLVRQLGRIAGEEFPKTAAELGEQRRANVRLELQNARLESDLSLVAQALIDDEFPTTEG